MIIEEEVGPTIYFQAKSIQKVQSIHATGWLLKICSIISGSWNHFFLGSESPYPGSPSLTTRKSQNLVSCFLNCEYGHFLILMRAIKLCWIG
jgi:hypothetical protein